MPELSLIEIIKYTIESLINSKVFILFILEIAILLIALIFSRIMNKKVVKATSVIASLVILGFYVSNYVETIITFINNVSTKLIEMLYFPTTLEFMLVMIVSFVIMFVTLLNKKSKTFIKVINSVLPITISFLFLTIIEYINTNNIPFDEFSVFTNPTLISLYELAMTSFITWLIGLIVYRIDLFIISLLNEKQEVIVKQEDDEEIELPKLKNLQN